MPPVLAKKVQPFCGCNCYYLLNKMSYSEGKAMVRRTLEGMREMGFNVIRMWAFDDGNDPNVNLQCSPGELTEHGKEHLKDLFVMLDDVNNKIYPKEPPMKFMMTLTNYLKDYGGIGQYVSWALHSEHRDESEADARRKETFFTSESGIAHSYYDKYVKALIVFCKDTMISDNNNGTTTPAKKLIDLVHSWDICNEPRCKFSQNFGAVTKWIQHAAQTIRHADGERNSEGMWVRPITVGLEGFFGPSSPGHHSCNPYNGCESEGVDWEAIGQLEEIDFMSIHLWPDQWKTNNPKEAIEWSEAWIKRHMEVCRDVLKKPLCLQEYNVSVGANAHWAARGLKGGKCLATSNDRFKLFEKVRELMKDPEDRENNPNVLIGAMVWMIADDEHRVWDKEGHMIVPVHAVAGRSLWDLGKVAADRCKPPPARPTV